MLFGIPREAVRAIVAAMPNILVGPLQTAINATGDFLAPPSGEHLLGTDEVGRDVLNLVVNGARISLTIALLATVISLVVGTTIGMTAGYYGGRADVWLMRLTDFFFIMPSFVLALVITPVVLEVMGRGGEILGFRPSLFVIIVVIGMTSWAFLARVVRSQTLHQTVSSRVTPFRHRREFHVSGLTKLHLEPSRIGSNYLVESQPRSDSLPTRLWRNQASRASGFQMISIYTQYLTDGGTPVNHRLSLLR